MWCSEIVSYMKSQNSKYFCLHVWEVFIFFIPINIQIGIWNPDVTLSRDLFYFGMISFYLHSLPSFCLLWIFLGWGVVVTLITSSRIGAANGSPTMSWASKLKQCIWFTHLHHLVAEHYRRNNKNEIQCTHFIVSVIWCLG